MVDTRKVHNAGFAAGTLFTDPELATAVTRGLEETEAILDERFSRGHDLMIEPARHLSDAGGKRFRPLFTILAAQLGPRPESADVPVAAAVVELIHLASLYHDDVMDEADLRRSAPTANALWGNNMAILTGDYVFAHASRLCADLGAEAVAIIADTFGELVAGQARETAGARPEQDPVEHYLRVVWEKTGALIATSGRFGAMFSGAEPEQVERVRRMGDAIGVAFQIADDIIDISSTADQSGKQPGTDLREGVYTLPVLYALREKGTDAQRLRALLAQPPSRDDEVAECLALLVRSPGMKRAQADLRRYVDRAFGELDTLPGGPANTALRNLVHRAVERAS
ncbi:polyprenyl synthetase family protein [Nocardia wallacei]|uniref:polyprenyl synthetase family protein n=1 Tax=Nocardia wallacei TaxID=480035 RepID=UPI0024548B0F|nr:polyprenyl synthetase family protein [Nocardia wallacei]